LIASATWSGSLQAITGKDNEARSLPPREAKAGAYVLCKVADTGIGIAPEFLDMIFDPFFTTKEQGKGTGLGLSTALGIVQAHGGTINAYSELGRGSVFTLYLPAEQPAAAARPLPAEDAPLGHRERLLLLDDEAPILATVKTALEAGGYRCLTAAGGAEALALYRERPGEIHAIVLDMMMPGLDGMTTMRLFRDMNAQAPIIATSGLRGHG